MTRAEIRDAISDKVALIATLLGESSGEPVESQIAVACVIRNRARKPRWWGRSIKGVCLAKSQFSCWWESNANAERVYALAEALHKNSAGVTSGLVGQLQWIAAGIVDDLLLDNTRGADHYLTHALLTSTKPPSWTQGKIPVASVGSHRFFRLET